MLLPRATTEPSALLPGAVIIAGTLIGMQAVSQLYLPDRFSRASQLYGAIGTTIVTLGWFFIVRPGDRAGDGRQRRHLRALRQHLARSCSRCPCCAPCRDGSSGSGASSDSTAEAPPPAREGMRHEPPRRSTVEEYEQRAEQAERSPVPTFLKIGRAIVWIVYAIVLSDSDQLLTLAFFLRLAGANPEAGFVEWVYRSADARCARSVGSSRSMRSATPRCSTPRCSSPPSSTSSSPC